MEINKRGMSPIITTVLLLAIVVILAIIILLWGRTFIPESIMKDGRNIERVCDDVAFEASYKDIPGEWEEILVSNNGNYNIYAFEIKLHSVGSVDTKEHYPHDISTGDVIDLVQGASGNMSVHVAPGVNKITITPILLGKLGENDEKYLCQNHPGEEILI